MITPSFFGLFNASRSLDAAQMAMNVINHNISNANTPGYSRQQIQLSEATPYALPVIGGDVVSAGQIGQGDQVDQVSRLRDGFLDSQYVSENSVLGNDSSIRDALQQVEGILNEPSKDGISTSLQNFFNAAQQLSTNPESMAVRTEFLQNAQDIVTVFQQQGNELATMQQNLVGNTAVPGSIGLSQLAINVNQVNGQLDTIAKLNQNINAVVASGAQPNDLYDQREQALESLSKLVDINVQQDPNGQIDVSIGGQKMIKGVTQLDSLSVVANPGPAPNPAYVPSLIKTTTGGVDITSQIAGGMIKGILDVSGYNTTKTNIQGAIQQLNTLLTTIATQVNQLQATGRNLSGNIPSAGPPDETSVFSLTGAPPTLNLFRYQVNPNLIADPTQIAAATNDPTAVSGVPPGFAGQGDGRNALAMAQLADNTFAALGNAGFSDYFNGMISSLGVDSSSYQNTSTNQQNLLSALDQQRQAVSGVNTNEEMVDLLRYQQTFQASSKVVNTFNQVMQSVLSMVG